MIFAGGGATLQGAEPHSEAWYCNRKRGGRHQGLLSEIDPSLWLANGIRDSGGPHHPQRSWHRSDDLRRCSGCGVAACQTWTQGAKARREGPCCSPRQTSDLGLERCVALRPRHRVCRRYGRGSKRTIPQEMGDPERGISHMARAESSARGCPRRAWPNQVTGPGPNTHNPSR